MPPKSNLVSMMIPLLAADRNGLDDLLGLLPAQVDVQKPVFHLGALSGGRA